MYGIFTVLVNLFFCQFWLSMEYHGSPIGVAGWLSGRMLARSRANMGSKPSHGGRHYEYELLTLIIAQTKPTLTNWWLSTSISLSCFTIAVERSYSNTNLKLQFVCCFCRYDYFQNARAVKISIYTRTAGVGSDHVIIERPSGYVRITVCLPDNTRYRLHFSEFHSFTN